MKKKIILIAFAALILGVGYSSVLAADAIKLKFANFFPPTHKNSAMSEKFCKDVTRMSNGKLEISHYTGGTLLTGPKMAAGVATAIADFGLTHVSYSRGRFPVMEIMELPLGFPSAYVAGHAVNDFWAKFKPKEFDTYQTLMFSTSPPNVVQTLSKPVRTLDDVKGMKIRAQGRIADITKAIGATPMPLEMADVYESLRRAVLDGNLGNFEQMKGWKTGELLKYASTTWQISSVNNFFIVMNKQKWNSLPPDMQKLIMDYSKDFAEEWAISWNGIEIEGRDFFLKQGGQIVQVPDAEVSKWTKAVEPVVADYKKDMVSKGYKAAEVDSWISFIRERVDYWKGQEKAKNIPTAYHY